MLVKSVFAAAIAVLAPIVPQNRDVAPTVLARFGSDRLRHAGWITSIAFSPGGRALAAGLADSTAILLDRAAATSRFRL